MPRTKRHVATARKNGSAVKAVSELQQENHCTSMAAACEMRDRKKRELLESRADLLKYLQKIDIILGMAKRMDVTTERKQLLVQVRSPPTCSGPPAADLSLAPLQRAERSVTKKLNKAVKQLKQQDVRWEELTTRHPLTGVRVLATAPPIKDAFSEFYRGKRCAAPSLPSACSESPLVGPTAGCDAAEGDTMPPIALRSCLKKRGVVPGTEPNPKRRVHFSLCVQRTRD